MVGTSYFLLIMYVVILFLSASLLLFINLEGDMHNAPMLDNKQ